MVPNADTGARCSMCEEGPATVFNKWPAPVCATCDEWLSGLDQDLDQMEKDDPALGKAAGEIADAIQQLGRYDLPPIDGTEP